MRVNLVCTEFHLSRMPKNRMKKLIHTLSVTAVPAEKSGHLLHPITNWQLHGELPKGVKIKNLHSGSYKIFYKRP